MTRFDTRKVGAGTVVAGVALLLVLRLWASPLASSVMGRSSVSVVTFLGIPALLVVVAAGIVLVLWGPELTAGR